MNVDKAVVSDFGDEWRRFDQSELRPDESQALFDQYFASFPWDRLGADAEGMDVGCGSGRWALHVSKRVRKLHCIDASADALSVARTNLSGCANCEFHHADTTSIPLTDGSLDFGYSLGVLHHVPDTLRALEDCARKLKPGAPFLVYLYYAFDNRPIWFRCVWKLSDIFRRAISRLPFKVKVMVTTGIAYLVYLPLARASLLAENMGLSVDGIPLSMYRYRSVYTMKTDALDRFGTKLEQRFSAEQVEQMMTKAGLRAVTVSSSAPYWCAIGFRA